MVTEPTDERSRPTGTPLGRRGRGHDRHPSVELIDAVAGGEQVTRSAREHIVACPACRESVAALRRVRSDLSRLASMTMPGDVAERIQAALATRVPGPSGEPGDEHTTTPDAPDDHATASSSGMAALTGVSPGRHAAVGGPVRRAGQPASARLAASPESDGSLRGTASSSGAPQSPAPPVPPAASRTPPARPHRGPRAGAARASGRPPTGPGPRLDGRGRRPGGHGGVPATSAAAPTPPRRDWLSIAAVCVAFMAFGTAVLAIYGLRGGGSAQTLPDPGRTPAAAEEAVVVHGSARSDLTTLADSRASLVQADVTRHALELLRGRVEGSQALALQLIDPWARSAAAQPTSAVSARSPQGAQAAPEGTTSLQAAVAGRLRALLDTPQLRICYQSVLAMTGGKILAIDRARFDEEPAILIVLSVPMRPSAARLVVVDAQCGMTSASATPLYSATTVRG